MAVAKFFKIILGLVAIIVALFVIIANWRNILWGLAIGSIAVTLARGGVLGVFLGVLFVGTIIFIIIDVLRDVL